MTSILDEIKHLCNICSTDDSFDTDIILHINTDFARLYQLKAGPSGGFTVTDMSDTWDMFTEDPIMLALVKSYVQASCRIKFDPPSNSTLMEALRQQKAEAEWSIQMHAEGYT